mgnify:CR=1 FL=1
MDSKKKSSAIEMDNLFVDNKKVKLGGEYFTKKGKIRKRYQGQLIKSGNKYYTTKDTYSYAFNASGAVSKEDLVFDDRKTLANSYLIEELAKDKDLKGSYRIIVKIDNEIVKTLDYNMDNLNDLNEMLNDGESPYKVFNRNLKPDSRVVIIFSKNKKIPKSVYEQKYLDAECSHCFLTDIQNYYEKRKAIQESLGKSTKKSSACINKIVGKKNKEGLLEKYKDGIPHDSISDVCASLGIGVKIFLPFQKEPILEYKPPTNNFYGKTFSYLNTRLNHLENKETFTHTDIYYKSFDAEPLDFQSLQDLVAEKIANNEYCAYKRGYYGITSAKTVDGYYILDDPRSEIFSQFREDTGLKWTGYNAITHPWLDKFITYGTHFNATVDFRDTSYLDEILANCLSTQNIIKHIDQYKAYSQFFNCKWYEGFCGKITDFRKHTGKATQVGLYYISKLDFTNANRRFVEYNEKLNWFLEGNIYTYAELKALEEYGVEYETEYGCWGADLDFRFTEQMLNEKYTVVLGDREHSVPYYSMFCGMMASDNDTTKYYMNGDHRYFGKFNDSVFYNEASGETHMVFKNPVNYKNKHITAQITAYQRLILLEQLMKMRPDTIYRVCVDGIYYSNHKFTLHKCFRNKEKMTFMNSPSTSYLSHQLVSETDRDELLTYLETLPEYREYYKSELWLGPGGTGKTYTNVEQEKGWINPVYVPHSWKLASNFSRDMKTLVHHSVVNDDKMNNWCKKYNVYILDECSMLTEHQKQLLLKNIDGRIIFLGDLTGQLKPVVKTEDIIKWKATLKADQVWRRMKQMAVNDIDYITELTYVWRFKCEILRRVANEIRECMKKNKKANTTSFQIISRDTVVDFYDYKTDIILCARKEGTKGSCRTYTNKFSHLDKYRIKENKNGYYNGDIVYEEIPNVPTELRHGFTVHSVQGETFTGKIFIDITDMNLETDLRMFYTAISRARYIHQIYLVDRD